MRIRLQFRMKPVPVYFTCPALVSVSGRELGPVSDQSPRSRSFFTGVGLELPALPYTNQITKD